MLSVCTVVAVVSLGLGSHLEVPMSPLLEGLEKKLALEFPDEAGLTVQMALEDALQSTDQLKVDGACSRDYSVPCPTGSKLLSPLNMFGLPLALLPLMFEVPTAAKDSEPDRTIGIQILNPHNMTVTLYPVCDEDGRSLAPVQWLEDNPTFPGDRPVPGSTNWQSYSNSVHFTASTYAAHGVMTFRCGDMPTLFGQARVRLVYQWDYKCEYGLQAQCNQCSPGTLFYYDHGKFCDEDCRECDRSCYKHSRASYELSMTIDCSKSANATGIDEDGDFGKGLDFIASQSSDDWWVFEIANQLPVNCPAECDMHCGPFNAMVI